MDEADQEKMLKHGVNLIASRRPKEAIEQALDPLIAHFEGKYADQEKIYSTRTMEECITYMTEAAASRTAAAVVTQSYGFAYYYKSYALTEMLDFKGSELALDKALELAPLNACFLGERGNALAMARKFSESLEIFRQAEAAAKKLSPPGARASELGRALRGQGFALIELRQLAEAEAVYLECLRLDPGDAKAAHQLEHARLLAGRTGP